MALHLCSQCFRLSILWRYPGDTLKWKKGTSRHQSPSSFQHNHISKFQKGKTQHNLIPNGTDTLGKFRTYKNAGKKNQWSKPCLPKHQLDAARTDFQKSFPPTKRNKASERIEFPNGVYLPSRPSEACKEEKLFAEKKSVQHNKLHVLWYKVCQPPPSSSL